MNTYYRRHYGTNKVYVALSRDGKQVGSVMAYSKAEAASELRSKGVKFSKLVRS